MSAPRELSLSDILVVVVVQSAIAMLKTSVGLAARTKGHFKECPVFLQQMSSDAKTMSPDSRDIFGMSSGCERGLKMSLHLEDIQEMSRGDIFGGLARLTHLDGPGGAPTDPSI